MTFEDKVIELLALRKKRDLLDIKIEKLEKALKDEMIETDKYEHSGEGWNLTWKLVEQGRFDQKHFKEDHPRLFEKYQTTTSFRRLHITG